MAHGAGVCWMFADRLRTAWCAWTETDRLTVLSILRRASRSLRSSFISDLARTTKICVEVIYAPFESLVEAERIEVNFSRPICGVVFMRFQAQSEIHWQPFCSLC